MSNTVISLLRDADRGRDTERLALKYAAMEKDPFVFFRGTCSLFYREMDTKKLPAAPLVWCSGDLHVQNFGTYKGDNRLVYFDLNDFDEACLAPATWDLVRLAASIFVLGGTLEMDRASITKVARACLESYSTALAIGKARWVERATAKGVIHDLLATLRKRKRKEFLRSRVHTLNGRRRLIIDHHQTLPLAKGEWEKLREFMRAFAARQRDPGFFRLLDAAHRIAGTGSLGLARYVLLIEGRGSPGGNFLIDLKLQPGITVDLSKLPPQPIWRTQAERVVLTQHDSEAVPPALLGAVEFDGKPFSMRELQPSNDRLDLSHCHSLGTLEHAMRTMGAITAWGNLRCASRRGAASADDLIAFGKDGAWQRALLAMANAAARASERDWRSVRRELKTSLIGAQPSA